ncbi:MAG: hypothetical protein JHC55_00705 [Mycolicibacterium sp.]|nr:hypothetical protein [Mycolicibacterium sp.]
MLADSGQAIVSNPGADPEGIGQIVASPIDGKNVLVSLDADSDTSYTHTTLSFDNAKRVVLQGWDFRFRSVGSTDYSVLAQIAWDNWAANNASTGSPNHTLFTRVATVAQTYVSLSETTMLTHAYAEAYGTQIQRAITAIDPVAGAVVILCPDGAIISYETPLATSLLPETSDHEFGRIAPPTDTIAEVLRMGACTLDGMTATVAAAYDALLAAKGYGSAWLAPSGPIQKSTSIVDSAASDTSPANASSSGHAGASGSNRVALLTVQVSPTVLSGTGHVGVATYGGVAMTSLGQVAVNNETDNPMYFVEKFILLGAPSGAQEFAVSYTKSGETYRITGVGETWENVTSYGTPVLQYGTGSPATQACALTTVAGDVAHYAFIAESSGSLSGMAGTVVRNQAQGTQRCPLVVEYKVATGTTTTETVTRALGTSDWANHGVVLKS